MKVNCPLFTVKLNLEAVEGSMISDVFLLGYRSPSAGYFV